METSIIKKEEFETQVPSYSHEDQAGSGVPLNEKSKKIHKKREKYQKINDEIRLQLLEAVNKKGELLKTAAKRLNVNYSSAKSIFFTYRKEGRIIRKKIKSRSQKACAKSIEQNLQIQQSQWNLNPLRWIGGTNSLLQTISRPFVSNVNTALNPNLPYNMTNVMRIPNQDPKLAINFANSQPGLQNMFLHQLKGQSTPLTTEQMHQMRPQMDCLDQNYKPNSHLVNSFRLFRQLQLQSLLSAMKNPISSFIGNQLGSTKNM